MRVLGCAVSILAVALSARAGNRQLLLASASSQAIQNARADDDDLSRMRDLDMVQRFASAGYLTGVPLSTRSYYLHAVSAPYRFSRPWTKLFLQRLSQQYYEKFKQRLRVTSLVRTVASQVRLARVNGNAADAFGPLRSSHLTGASLDISKHGMSPVARRWMRKVLYSLRRGGYLYAIEEFQQPTFHVMVFRNYPEYVKQVTGAQERYVAVSSGDSQAGGDE